MKRLLCLLLLISTNVTGLFRATNVAQKNGRPKNMQVCWNSPHRNFGTTHFIVGHKDQSVRIPAKKLEPIQSTPVSSHLVFDKNRISQSFFTTVHDLSPIILSVIADAKKSVWIAAYSLTDLRIADHLVRAHNGGVDVCVIVDAGNVKQIYSKVRHLAAKNVPIWCYDSTLNKEQTKKFSSEPLMHHKIIISDDVVVTGSANFTRAGQGPKKNVENIIIVRDEPTVKEYCEEFQRLKQYCTKYVP
jgi:phosphatidylserine/phosphatidylglycerophosphate/cardiolipin synthase-like enzyme